MGERGPAPKAAPTFPELCCHSLDDFEILNSREKISYSVDDQRPAGPEGEVIPYWQGRSHARPDLRGDDPGVEERVRGGHLHRVHGTTRARTHRPGRRHLPQRPAGPEGRYATALSRLDFFNDPEASAKRDELRAMAIAADAVIRFAERHAEKAEELARTETDPRAQAELHKIAEVCRHVPAHAPREFLGGIAGLLVRPSRRGDGVEHLGFVLPGALRPASVSLLPKGVEDGTLTREQAKELLECLWVKFNNQPAPPKVGVTAAESGTYTDFANINNGGLKRDGSDGVNDVTYLILDVIDEMHLLQPSSNLQLSKKNPDAFLKRGLEIVRQGWGQPSIFNADMVVEELLRQGKSIEDARCGGTSGCVETGAFGKEAYILTGYFNLPKVLEITLNNGVDPRTGKKIGIETGDPRAFSSYEQLFAAFRQQLHHFIDIKVRGNNVIERLYARLHAGARSSPCWSTTASRRARTTTMAARATTPHTSWEWRRLPVPTALRRSGTTSSTTRRSRWTTCWKRWPAISRVGKNCV